MKENLFVSQKKIKIILYKFINKLFIKTIWIKKENPINFKNNWIKYIKNNGEMCHFYVNFW